jgi:hypothetical protein
LLERVQRIEDRTLGLLAALRGLSLAPRPILRILGGLRFSVSRGAQVLVTGGCGIARRPCRRRTAPPAQPIADPGRRVGRRERHDRFCIQPQQAEYVLAGKLARWAGALVAEIAEICHHPIGIGTGASAFAPDQRAIPARADARPFGRFGESGGRLERGLIGGELLDRFQINRHALVPNRIQDGQYIGPG